MPSFDYIIVGGGIAGFAIANYLENENQNFLIINQDLDGAATKVSSGLINPVTGQRFVLSWKYSELESEFLKFYTELGNKFEEQFIVQTQLFQLLRSIEEQNLWLSRTADPLYATYFGDTNNDLSTHFHSSDATTTGIIKSIYLIKINELLQKLETHHANNGSYLKAQFNFNELIRTPSELIWKDICIRKAIVFAEGFRVLSNPFFNWLPIIPLKGECLQIEIPGMQFNSVFKSDYALIPMHDCSYWCGSNFYLHETKLETSETEKQNQLDFLHSILNHRFKLEKHSFGIRPASRDRRPIIGPHPHDPRLIVFNGLGTKGLSLAPYCAHHLANWLLSNVPIPIELSLLRFKSKGFESPALISK